MTVQVTHLGHACVLLETATARLLIDPGTLAAGFEDVHDLDAVLVTHQHPDHLDPARLPALLAANPGAAVYADEGSAPALAELGATPVVVTPGRRIRIGAGTIDVVGGSHAVVHPLIPVVPNAGYVLDDGAFFHPGDSFFRPVQSIDVLAVPTSGPWLKLAEAIDYVREVKPRVAIPIHEGALANTRTHHHYLGQFVPPSTTFVEPERGRAVLL